MYQYYNNNPLGRHVNDCSVRAIALATDESWDNTYKILSDYARHQGITFSEIEFIDEYLDKRFQKYCLPQNSSLFTLKDFLSLSLKGRWLITMANHITCAIDGVCYDTFDPSDRLIWCVYFVKD